MSPFALLTTLLNGGGESNPLAEYLRKDQKEFQYAHRFNGELYPKEISSRMLTTACCISIPCVAALYYECYLLFISIFMLFAVSVNYWRKPVEGLRRNADIVNTVFQVSLHLMYCIVHADRETGFKYFGVVASAFLIYCMSKVAQLKGYFHLDSCFHCTLHLWTFWNFWMYRQLYLQRNGLKGTF